MASVYDPPAIPVKLAPSDLTFLWEECQRFFWLKVKGVLKRPPAPFPKTFTRLDQRTKDYFFGKRTEEMAEGLRAGRAAFVDRWSAPGPWGCRGTARLVLFMLERPEPPDAVPGCS